MKRFLLIISAVLISYSVCAQQTRKVTRTFFPNPEIEFGTPAFNKKHGFTTYKEMMDYLYGLSTAYHDRMSFKIVGRSQEGVDIPMIKISKGGDVNKLRVLYTGCVHGNEPAGTEGLLYFIKQLLSDKKLTSLLDSIDFYIIPMVNVDGHEDGERFTSNGIDLNRDQTMLSTPEARMMHRVASSVSPHVYVDFHEYKPLRASYEEVSDGALVTNPNDFMFLWSSNPNVSSGLRNVVERLYVPEASSMAKQEGLVHTTYFTTKNNRGEVVFNIGGSSPRSSSNIMALRGMVSMLMEIRGVGLGRTSYKRRVYTVYKLAESFAQTTYRNGSEIRKVVKMAMNEMKDIAVKFKSKAQSDYPLTFIDMLSCKKIELLVEARIAQNSEVMLERSRPKGYYLNASESKAADILRAFGVVVEEIKEPVSLELETYSVTSMTESHEFVAGILPLNVNAETKMEKVNLDKGSYYVSMSQPLATLIAILLEPESANGFVNYRVIGVDSDGNIGLYRNVK